MLTKPEPALDLHKLGIEPNAVVDDPQRDRVRGRGQRDLGVLRAAVLDGIAQRFLRDAIEAHRRVGRNRRRQLTIRERDLETVARGELLAEAAIAATSPSCSSLEG